MVHTYTLTTHCRHLFIINMLIQYDIDKSSVDALHRTMAKYTQELGLDARKVLVKQAGLLSLELMAQTPPYGGKRAGSNELDAKKNAIKQIERDLKKAAKTEDNIFSQPLESKDLRSLLRKGNTTNIEAVFAKIRPGIKAVRFTEDLHTDNRPGIYSKARSQNKLTPDKAKWKQYLKKITDRIGYMKAGWGIAAQAMGRKVPAWIAKHIPYARGFCKVTETPTNMTIEMANASPTISQYSNRLSHAVDTVNERMGKDLKAQLDHLAQKYNRPG